MTEPTKTPIEVDDANKAGPIAAVLGCFADMTAEIEKIDRSTPRGDELYREMINQHLRAKRSWDAFIYPLLKRTDAAKAKAEQEAAAAATPTPVPSE